MAIVFAILPCALGIGAGLLLTWTGTVWLSDTRGVWPIFCLAAAIAAACYLATTNEFDRITYGYIWLLLAWTWLYVPLWLLASGIPRSAALVERDGTVQLASEWSPVGTATVWILSGRSGSKVVHNVDGNFAASGVDVHYRFAKPYLASQHHGTDLAGPIAAVVGAALAAESKATRASRIALFHAPQGQDRLLTGICRAFGKDDRPCPVKLTLVPQRAATAYGGLWSKQYTEAEAIAERDLATLGQLLTGDNARLVARDRVFALFLELANAPADLAKVARKPRLLDDRQFDALVERILAAPDAGNEALGLAADVIRLRHDQREALRAKALREASITAIIRHPGIGRISDAEVTALSDRMPAAFLANPEVAVGAIEVLGPRLPREVQEAAVAAIATKGKASLAIAALRHLNFAGDLRHKLVRKVLADADLKELEAGLPREKLEDVLMSEELRPLIERVLGRSSAKDWLDYAVKALPLRAMTVGERRRLIDEVTFASAKTALEFVSENRQHLEPGDVEAVTSDYVHTITRDMCLHLTHRNANRQTDYFSAAQIAIFERCAEGK